METRQFIFVQVCIVKHGVGSGPSCSVSRQKLRLFCWRILRHKSTKQELKARQKIDSSTQLEAASFLEMEMANSKFFSIFLDILLSRTPLIQQSKSLTQHNCKKNFTDCFFIFLGNRIVVLLKVSNKFGGHI